MTNLGDIHYNIQIAINLIDNEQYDRAKYYLNGSLKDLEVIINDK